MSDEATRRLESPFVTASGNLTLTMDHRDALAEAIARFRALKEAIRLFIAGEGDVPNLSDAVRETAYAYFLELMEANVDAIEETLESAEAHRKAVRD